MLDDPAAAAWVLAGRPAVAAPLQQEVEPCARCGIHGEQTVSSRRIISEQFTGYEDWPYGLRRLCTPCAWAYAYAAPKARTVLTIGRDRVTRHRSAVPLARRLRTGPLEPETAIVISGGQRYTVPHAAWGQVTGDRVRVTWTARQAEVLRAVSALRAMGFSWPAVTKLGQPPRDVLLTRPVEQWPAIVELWQQVAPWRALPGMWSVARSLLAD